MRLGTILLLAAALLGQDSPSKKFTGTWEARFNGAVFCVLKIQTDEKLAGSMSSVDIDVDEDGNLRSAQAKNEEVAILRPNIENDNLHFEWNDDPNEKPLKFEMTITGNGQAELRFLTTPEDVKIKPFKFTRRD